MAPSVSRWLKRSGLLVKREFATPWGACDLVGLRFNEARIDQRLALGQTKAVSSLTRAALLMQIAEAGSPAITTASQMVAAFAPILSPQDVERELLRLESDRFIIRSDGGRIQKLNGWAPMQERLVSVELKLGRVGEAMLQASNNLGLGGESFVALPAAVAERLVAAPGRWQTHLEGGVGVLSVTPRTCVPLIHSKQRDDFDPAVHFYVVEKFWRRRLTGS